MTSRSLAHWLGGCLLALAGCIPAVSPGQAGNTTTPTSKIACVIKMPLNTSSQLFGINGPPRGLNGPATGINTPPRGINVLAHGFGIQSLLAEDLPLFKVNFLRNGELIKTTWSVKAKGTEGELALADCNIEGPLGSEPATIRATSPSGKVILYVHAPNPANTGLVTLDLDSTAVELIRTQAPGRSLQAIEKAKGPVVQALREVVQSDALVTPITEAEAVKQQVEAAKAKLVEVPPAAAQS